MSLPEKRISRFIYVQMLYDMFFSISQNTGSLPFTVCNIAFLMEGKKDFRCV